MTQIAVPGREGFNIWAWQGAGSGGARGGVGGGVGTVAYYETYYPTLFSDYDAGDTELCFHTPDSSIDDGTMPTKEQWERMIEFGYKNVAIGIGTSTLNVYEIESFRLADNNEDVFVTIASPGLASAINSDRTACFGGPMGVGGKVQLPDRDYSSLVVRCRGHSYHRNNDPRRWMFNDLNGSSGGFNEPANAWYDTLGPFTSWYTGSTSAHEVPAVDNGLVTVGVIHGTSGQPYGIYVLNYNVDTHELVIGAADDRVEATGLYTPAAFELVVSGG